MFGKLIGRIRVFRYWFYVVLMDIDFLTAYWLKKIWRYLNVPYFARFFVDYVVSPLLAGVFDALTEEEKKTAWQANVYLKLELLKRDLAKALRMALQFRDEYFVALISFKLKRYDMAVKYSENISNRLKRAAYFKLGEYEKAYKIGKWKFALFYGKVLNGESFKLEEVSLSEKKHLLKLAYKVKNWEFIFNNADNRYIKYFAGLKLGLLSAKETEELLRGLNPDFSWNRAFVVYEKEDGKWKLYLGWRKCFEGEFFNEMSFACSCINLDALASSWLEFETRFSLLKEPVAVLWKNFNVGRWREILEILKLVGIDWNYAGKYWLPFKALRFLNSFSKKSRMGRAKKLVVLCGKRWRRDSEVMLRVFKKINYCPRLNSVEVFFGLLLAFRLLKKGLDEDRVFNALESMLAENRDNIRNCATCKLNESCSFKVLDYSVKKIDKYEELLAVNKFYEFDTSELMAYWGKNTLALPEKLERLFNEFGPRSYLEPNGVRIKRNEENAILLFDFYFEGVSLLLAEILGFDVGAEYVDYDVEIVGKDTESIEPLESESLKAEELSKLIFKLGDREVKIPDVLKVEFDPAVVSGFVNRFSKKELVGYMPSLDPTDGSFSLKRFMDVVVGRDDKVVSLWLPTALDSSIELFNVFKREKVSWLEGFGDKLLDRFKERLGNIGYLKNYMIEFSHDPAGFFELSVSRFFKRLSVYKKTQIFFNGKVKRLLMWWPFWQLLEEFEVLLKNYMKKGIEFMSYSFLEGFFAGFEESIDVLLENLQLCGALDFEIIQSRGSAPNGESFTNKIDEIWNYLESEEELMLGSARFIENYRVAVVLRELGLAGLDKLWQVKLRITPAKLYSELKDKVSEESKTDWLAGLFGMVVGCGGEGVKIRKFDADRFALYKKFLWEWRKEFLKFFEVKEER